MLKMSTDLMRHALNGPTMGTRWSALFFTAPGFDPAPVQAALQASVDAVDGQMSTWNSDSDLMRLNAAPVGIWFAVPPQLLRVLELGVEIGRASGGAFDMGMGDAVAAWGFGPEAATPDRIRKAMAQQRIPAYEAMALDGTVRKVCKKRSIALDLNGIAKGYGVDQLADVLRGFGITSGLVGIDGEMRAFGLRPDASPWTIAIEAPDPERRAPHSMLELEDAAVATSGDYRHWVEVGDKRLSHSMDPRKGAPVIGSPASVTVIAQSCAEADAWATALMVLGPEAGAVFAQKHGLSALFLMHADGGGIKSVAVGPVFT